MGSLKFKLIGAGIAVVLIFGFGFKVASWKCDAEQKAALEAAYDHWKAAADSRNEQMKVDQAARAERMERIAYLERLTASLTGELKNAELASPQCDRLLTDDGIRLFERIRRLSARDPEG